MATIKEETESDNEATCIKTDVKGGPCYIGEKVGHPSVKPVEVVTMNRLQGVIKQEINNQECIADTGDQNMVCEKEDSTIGHAIPRVQEDVSSVPAIAPVDNNASDGNVITDGVLTMSMEVASEETVSQDVTQLDKNGLTAKERSALTSLLTEHLVPVPSISRHSGRKRQAKVIKLPGEQVSRAQSRGRATGKKSQKNTSASISTQEKCPKSSGKRVNLLRSGSKRRREEELKKKEAERMLAEMKKRARAKRKNKQRHSYEKKEENVSDSEGEDQSAGIIIPPDRICNLCGKQVLSDAAYIGHIQMHNRHQNCPKCKAAFPNQTLDPAHCCKPPKSYRKTYDCRTCGKTFRSELGREKHEVAHWAPKKFECRFCERKFATKIGSFQHSMTCFKKAAY